MEIADHVSATGTCLKGRAEGGRAGRRAGDGAFSFSGGGVLAPKGDCPVPAEDSRVVNRLAAGSFPFREDASKGRKRSGRGIYPLWLEFSFRRTMPEIFVSRAVFEGLNVAARKRPLFLPEGLSGARNLTRAFSLFPVGIFFRKGWRCLKILLLTGISLFPFGIFATGKGGLPEIFLPYRACFPFPFGNFSNRCFFPFASIHIACKGVFSVGVIPPPHQKKTASFTIYFVVILRFFCAFERRRAVDRQ